MMKRFQNALQKCLFLLIGLILLNGATKMLPPQSTAADNKSPKQQKDHRNQIDHHIKRQKNLRLEIEQGRQEVKAFTRKENEIIKRLNRVDQALNKSRNNAAALAKEIKLLDDQILAGKYIRHIETAYSCQ